MKVFLPGADGEERLVAFTDVNDDGSISVASPVKVEETKKRLENPSWYWLDGAEVVDREGTGTAIVLARENIIRDELMHFVGSAAVGRWGHRVSLALYCKEWTDQTFVHLAAQEGSVQCLKFLLFSLGPAMCMRQDRFHQQARDFAIETDHEVCAKMLTFDIPSWLSEALDVIESSAEARVVEIGLWALWLRCCNIQVDLFVGEKMIDVLRKNLSLPQHALDELAQFLVSAPPDYECESYMKRVLELFVPAEILEEISQLSDGVYRAGVSMLEKVCTLECRGWPGERPFGPQCIVFATQQLRHLTKPVNWHICAECGGLATQLCSGCELTYFCSRDCSVRNWPHHRQECRDVRLVKECLESGMCTRTVTDKNFYPHRGRFECRACDILVARGGALCRSCALFCHEGHDGVQVQEKRNCKGKRMQWACMFCDCPETGCCQKGGK